MTRQNRSSVLPAAALLLLMPHSSTAQASASPPDMATVIVTVLAPKGQPLKHQAVKAFLVDDGAISPISPVGETNARGQLALAVPFGLQRIWITAPGIGYGSTGLLSISRAANYTAAMPPLAQFAQLSGTVAPELRAPGETVTVDNNSGLRRSYVTPAPVLPNGQWTLHDVFPGDCPLSLQGSPKPSAFVSVIATPGKTSSGILLTPFIPPAIKSIGPWISRTTSATLRGSVTNTLGQPVAHVQVTATIPDPHPPMSYSGPPQWAFGHPTTVTTQTDANGQYSIPHVVFSEESGLLSLSATCPGYPIATAQLRMNSGHRSGLTANLVLSTQHTALAVRVLHQGQPVSGATVFLLPQTGNSLLGRFYASGILSIWTQMLVTDDSNGVPATVAQATTDAQGLVRFVDLTPGVWTIYTTSGKPPHTVQTGILQGIPVQADHATACAVSIAALPSSSFAVHVLGVNGFPVSLSPSQIHILEAGSRLPVAMSPTMDSLGQGATKLQYLHGGLWRASIDYFGHSPLHSGIHEPARELRCHAGGLFALSPAVSPPTVLTLQSVQEPCRLDVRLEDASGTPVLGTATVSRFINGPDLAGTTTADGAIQFFDMPSGQYVVSAYQSGKQSPPLLNPRMIPPDPMLTGQTEFVPQTLQFDAAAPAAFVLRAQPVGYVRIHVHLTGSDKITQYMAFPLPQPDVSLLQAGYVSDPKTNDILVGPCLLGKTSFTLDHFDRSHGSERAGTVTATVQQDQVAQVSFTPIPTRATERYGPLPVTGVVMLNDDKTPAWNAQAVLYQPQEDRLTAQQPANALGQLPDLPNYAVFSPISMLPSPSTPTGESPAHPVLIAWMPGLTGAAIVPYVQGQPAHIVLPPPLSLSGRVTVAGKPISLASDSTFRVEAAYQGRGALNTLLSLDITTEPDGTFTLNGLTPGTYQVQAARDGIWLSQTQTLTVGQTDPAPLTLNIGAPGAPVALPLTDGQSHRLPGAMATLHPPPGPLADLLWPKTLHADGAGLLHLDGLTAGQNTVTVNDKTITFTVPPAKGGKS